MFEFGILHIAMAIVSVISIILAAMQSSKEDLNSALSGSNSELFKQQKERGAEVYIIRATYIFSFLFIALGAIILFR